MDDFLSFRKFITPMFIQIIFWVFVGMAVIAGLTAMLKGGMMILGGPIMIAIGVFLARIYCELLILLFRIYDELVAIRTGVPPTAHQPLGYPAPAPATAYEAPYPPQTSPPQV